MGTMVAPDPPEVGNISDRLSHARGTLRRVLWRHGLGVLVATMLIALVVIGLMDWLFHVSPGMRVLFLIVLAGLAGWTIFHRLVRPLAVPVSDLQLALRIERLHPDLEETLSSTIALAPPEVSDVRAGSSALRQALLELARQRAEPIRFEEVVDPRPSRRALGWAGAVSLGTALLAILFPISTSTALARLVHPFGSVEWPRRTQIVGLEYLKKMAKGDPFQVRVDVAGVIPDRISIEYRFADGQQAPPTLLTPAPVEPTEPGSASNGTPRGPKVESFATTLEAASQPFEFAIRGGDADTDWLAVDVVPAPDVDRLDVTVTPPAYTGLPANVLPEGKGHVRGVVGSTVAVRAKSNKPIRAGKLAWESQPETPGVIDPSKVELQASFVIEKTDTYRIFLEDEQGMTNEHRSPRLYRVDAQVDAPPEVKIEKPTEDMEVTRQAKIPIRWNVRDDFGIQSIDRLFTIEKPGAPSPAEGAQPTPAESAQLWSGTDRPRQTVVDEEWDLAPLALADGSVVVFRGVARDHRTSPGPNVGESRPMRLLVVSQADLVRQIDNEQKLIREEIERLQKMEETALQQTTELVEQARAQGSLDPASKEKLQTVEMTQRRIREKTTGQDGSIQDRIRQLSEKLAANRVNDLDTSKRLSLMDSELGRIQEQHLAPIESDLNSARKGLAGNEGMDKPKNPPTGEAGPAEDLDQAKEHQQQVVESLDAMLEQLDKWESVADVVNEARDVERRQAEVAKQVSELTAKTLGKSEADLSAEEKGSLAQAGAQQEELRQQLHRLERKMAKQAEKGAADDPVAAEAMKEALEQSRQSNIGGKMSDAAGKIRENQLAEAGADQNQISQSLREMVESLENRREQDLKRLVKNLKQAEEDLAGIREEQKKLRKETQQAGQENDPQKREEALRRLGQRQEELRKKAEEFARRLSQLQAKGASQNAGRAASRMNDATGQMNQGQGENADQEQDQAEGELEEAAQELAEARQQAEEQLAREQLAKVADTIKLIRDRQQSLKDDVARLDALREKEGKLTRGQIQSVLGLSRAEKGLADESAALQEQLAEAKVFRLVIEEAVAQMNKGAAQLAEKETGLAAQKPLDKAGQKFTQLIDSLRQDPLQKKGKKQGQQGGEGGEGGGGGDAGDGIPSIAQIKLLRSLQQEILDDSKGLADIPAGQEPQRDQEMEELAQRQGRLADLVRDLMKPTGDGSDEEGTP